jgi:hypothetical protein
MWQLSSMYCSGGATRVVHGGAGIATAMASVTGKIGARSTMGACLDAWRISLGMYVRPEICGGVMKRGYVEVTLKRVQQCSQIMSS